MRCNTLSSWAYAAALIGTLCFFAHSVIAAEHDIYEYGIVIIPEKECVNSAKNLNSIIKKNLPDLENVHNNWHVTLYHGAYKKEDLPKIKAALAALNTKSFDMKFTKFYTTADRWVDWGTEKTELLQRLHENVVKVVSPYHKRPLDRARDVYNLVDLQRKKQIDLYGVPGVMELYNPHMTLFYTYPANSSIQIIPEIIKNDQYENVICTATQIAIGKLGYNGNITEIVDTIELN